MANKIGKYKVSKRDHILDLYDQENNTPTSLTVGGAVGVSASSGNAIFDVIVDAKDIIFRQYDDTEVLRIEDNATLQIVGEGGINIASNSNSPIIKNMTNSKDYTLAQFDGSECARVHDGGTTQSDTDMTAVGYGLGFKKPIMSVSADGGDKTVTLSADDSGAIIQCDADTGDIVFNLPVIDAAAKAGLTYTFVNTTAVASGKTIKVNTNGTDGGDKFLLYGFNGATSITDVAGDTLTIPNSAAIGTVVRITCLASGASNAAEIWLAEVFGASAVTNG